jgi:uncharacterized membrane protein YkoI
MLDARNPRPLNSNAMQAQRRYNVLAVILIATVVTSCVSGHDSKETKVSLNQMSPAARRTLEKVTAGGTIEKIDREVERGRVVYDAEATVGGKHVEYVIGDSNGEILGTETEIELSQLPEAVRFAAGKYFDTSADLKAMKGVDYGRTQYEIEGKKNGKVVEVTFEPTGKLVR